MKAVIYEKYGTPEVLQLAEVSTPELKDNEVLVKLHATAVNSGDIRLRKADPFAIRFVLGLFHPRKKILGVVFAGEVEEVGDKVTLFKEGDPVYGNTGMQLGTYAEYICIPEDGALSIKPSKFTHKEAAAIPFGCNTALHFLRKGKISTNQKVLIYGASGAVGIAAVQLAKYFGAEVTGVCSTSNLEMVMAMGAHHVIDYTKEDFTKRNETYDIVFDATGKSNFSGSVKSLKENGSYLRVVHMSISSISKGIWTSLSTNKKVIGGVAEETKENLVFLNNLIESGHLKPVIDRSYALEEMVEAHTYVEKGHKKGNVVITLL